MVFTIDNSVTESEGDFRYTDDPQVFSLRDNEVIMRLLYFVKFIIGASLHEQAPHQCKVHEFCLVSACLSVRLFFCPSVRTFIFQRSTNM